MTHVVTRKWGLSDKVFENAYAVGERTRLQDQIIALAAEMEELKLDCPHNEGWLRHKHHQFKHGWGVSYWTTSECANCGSILRSNDETYRYRVEED
jgi:hypothetical protein